MKRILVLALAVTLLCGCTDTSVKNNNADDGNIEPNDVAAEKLPGNADAPDSIEDDEDKTEYSISEYDAKPSGDGSFIGVFYDGNFYSWLAQIKNEDEINSYIAQGEYIGESKEKQIVYEGTSNELIDGADDWSPDSDLECNGLNAGTPLYRLNDYIFAVYNTPVETDRFTVHESDGTQHDIISYIYGNLYRISE